VHTADLGPGPVVEPDGPAAPSLILLAFASSLSPFGMSVIFPVLPEIAASFNVSTADAQFLIAVYLFGLAVGQPVAGIAADRFGRRVVMLSGFVLFTLSSVACRFMPDFAMLVALRFVQALGVSVGTIVSRAVISDSFDALAAARALSWIGAAMGVAPMLGPVIGGGLAAWADPLAVFAVSAGLGFGLTGALFIWLREPNRAAPITGDQPGLWPGVLLQLVRSPAFMGHTLLFAFTQGSFFAFLAVGAAVFDQHLQIGPQTFGVIWGGMSMIYVVGAIISARLARRAGTDGALRTSTRLSAAAGGLLLLATVFTGVTLPGLLLPIAILMIAAGIQTPLSMAGVLNSTPALSGTAAGLSSSMALGLGGAFSIVSGQLYAGSFIPVAMLMASAATMTLLAHRIAQQPARLPLR